MVFIAIIIFVLILFGLFVSILPVLLGLLIGIGVNIYNARHRRKLAPIWWDLLCALVTVASSVMFYKDVSSDSTDYGAAPFILLVCFGFISIILIAIPVIKKESKKTKAPPMPKPTEAPLTREERSDFVYPPEWKIKETWEDYPLPNYDEKHTYCKVAFDDSGKYYYFRTRNPDIKVGDTVRVPFGYKYERKVGRVVDVKEYKGSKAPYPLEKTKHIIEKIEADTEEK